MQNVEHNEVILSENDIMNLILSGSISKLKNIYCDNTVDIEKFNSSVNENCDDLPTLRTFNRENESRQEFDSINQKNWFMPNEYKMLDIENYLLSMCQTDIERKRVNLELNLYKQYKFLDVLRFLKFFVDKTNEENILIGVGRGSSVASYCLFLLGVHKINSIKYGLDIHEFLKEGQ